MCEYETSGLYSSMFVVMYEANEQVTQINVYVVFVPTQLGLLCHKLIWLLGCVSKVVHW